MLIEIEEFGEIEKLALSRFWAEIARSITAWADGSLEHEVECYRRRRLDTGGRVLEIVVLDEFAKCLAIVVVDLEVLVY